MAQSRILYYISSLDQGGAERQLAELLRHLDLSRYEPFLALSSARDQLGYALPTGAPHVLPGPEDPRAGWALLRLLNQLRPAVIHSYMGGENLLARVCGRRAGVKVVSSVRCTRLSWKYLQGERWTHPLADAVVVNSVGIRDELVARAGVPLGKLHVIENGVDPTRFAPLTPEARTEARARYGLEGTLAVLVSGRVCLQKNQVGVLRALARLRSQGALPQELRVLFAGRGAPAWYAAALKALGRALGVDPWVRWLGLVNPIAELVGAVDAVLLPSHYEGLPNAVIEAMTCGAPALVSPAANADRLVTDGVEGLHAGTSPEEIARALARLAALDDGARRALGQRGHAHARERFAVERMARRTMALYESLLG
ncbi:MAG: glycosyltransferase [Deltaproteobacteria bacterium]|nr:glycosyltransferase [Deltaproteobacteria bacterium]